MQVDVLLVARYDLYLIVFSTGWKSPVTYANEGIVVSLFFSIEILDVYKHAVGFVCAFRVCFHIRSSGQVRYFQQTVFALPHRMNHPPTSSQVHKYVFQTQMR